MAGDFISNGGIIFIKLPNSVYYFFSWSYNSYLYPPHTSTPSLSEIIMASTLSSKVFTNF